MQNEVHLNVAALLLSVHFVLAPKTSLSSHCQHNDSFRAHIWTINTPKFSIVVIMQPEDALQSRAGVMVMWAVSAWWVDVRPVRLLSQTRSVESR